MNAERYRRLQQIFLEACRVREAERSGLLDEACGADAALRAEVEALLAHDRKPAAAVERAAEGGGVGMLADAIAGDDAPPVELPATIGRFAIRRLIGEGGMGIVYEAEQQDPRRRVALKVIRPGMVTPGLLRRFRHEAQVLGQLAHPGIARIYDAGTADRGEGGQPWFAMELIEGRPLPEYATDGRLGTRDRLDLIARVCDALHHAHSKGVIHRDLKPANVLVDEGGQPKVLDFGVARATDADMQTVTMRTDVGQLVGTVPYMSPEQAGGEPNAVDTRSDVYSLGVIAFELLTGRLPYAVQGKMIHEAVRVIREEEPSRLSTVDRTLRGDVETIVARALAKEPERRYQSAAELAADIRRYLRDEPIVARPASALYQVRKFARRHKAIVGGVAATVVVSIAGAAVATRYAVLADRRAEEIAHRERAAVRQSYGASISAAAAALREGDHEIAARYLAEAPEAHRGWEWRHLDSQLRPSVARWPASARIVRPPVLGPDGTRLFAELEGRRIGEWDVARGTQVRTVELDEGAAGPVAIHGPSMRFAAASDGPGLAIGNLATGEVDRVVPTGDRVTRLAWDAPGQRLAFVASRRIWVLDGAEPRVLGPAGDAAAIAFSRAGDRLAVGHLKSETVALFDVAAGTIVATAKLGDEPNGVLVFSGEDRRLLVGCRFRNVIVLDGATLQERARLVGHRAMITSAEFSADGRTITTVGADGSARWWDAASGLSRAVVPFSDRGFGVTLPDGRLAMAGNAIEILDPGRGSSSVLRGHESYVYWTAFSPDSTLVASSTFADQTVRLWDPLTATEVARFPAPRPGKYSGSDHPLVPSLGFTADGRLVAATSVQARAWDLATGREAPVAAHDNIAEAIVAGLGYRNGARIAHNHVYSSTGASSRDVLARLGLTAYRCAFSPDGTRLATTHKTPEVRVFDVETAREIAVLEGHVGQVYAVAFSPDGTRIATGGNDTTVRIWDAATFEELLELRGHEQYVMDLGFSPDGTMLASASGDFTLRVWDSVEPAERERQRAERGPLNVRGAAVVPPGQRTATVAITELMVAPRDEWQGRQWIELYNYGSHPVDLRGWTISDWGRRAFTFPAVTLPPGECLVVAADEAKFRQEWRGGADDPRVIGDFEFALSGSGDEEVFLLDAHGGEVWNVGYTGVAAVRAGEGYAVHLVPSDWRRTDWGNIIAAGVDWFGPDPPHPTFGGRERGYEHGGHTPDPAAWTSSNGDVGSPLVFGSP